MKVQLSEIVEMARKKGKVRVVDVARHYGVDEARAWRAIQILIDKGKLAPFSTSFFGVGLDGNLPNWGSTMDQSWYEGEVKKFWEWYDSRAEAETGMGCSINDVKQGLEISRATAVNLLTFLTEKGDLLTRMSDYGGAFGNRPRLFGRNESDMENREGAYLAKDDEVRAKRSATRRKHRS